MPRTQKSFAGMDAIEVRALEVRTSMYHEASREPGTNANRNRYIRYYEEICEARGKAPWPAQQFNVACFLVKYCESIKSTQSLDNALSAIRTEALEQWGQQFTRAQEWYLKRVRRGLRKTYRQRTRRKRPLTTAILLQLFLRADLERLPDLQHLTQGFVQHDACLRTKEALNLRWSDVSLNATSDLPTAGLRIRVSKARYEQAAETVHFPAYKINDIVCCAVRLLAVYMADPRVRARQSGDGEAFLFPSLVKGAEKRQQTHEAVVRWYQKRLQEAGYDSAEFAGHSFRAGGATDLHTGKVPEVLGRLLGRWRCREAYFLYLREDPSLQAAQIRDAFEAAFEVTTEDSG